MPRAGRALIPAPRGSQARAAVGQGGADRPRAARGAAASPFPLKPSLRAHGRAQLLTMEVRCSRDAAAAPARPHAPRRRWGRAVGSNRLILSTHEPGSLNTALRASGAVV